MARCTYALKAAVERNPMSGKERTGGHGRRARWKETLYKVRDDGLACKRRLKPNQSGDCTSLRFISLGEDRVLYSCFARNAIWLPVEYYMHEIIISVDIFIRKLSS